MLSFLQCYSYALYHFTLYICAPQKTKTLYLDTEYKTFHVLGGTMSFSQGFNGFISELTWWVGKNFSGTNMIKRVLR